MNTFTIRHTDQPSEVRDFALRFFQEHHPEPPYPEFHRLCTRKALTWDVRVSTLTVEVLDGWGTRIYRTVRLPGWRARMLNYLQEVWPYLQH